MPAASLKDSHMAPNFVHSLCIIGTIPSNVIDRFINRKIEIISIEHIDSIINFDFPGGVIDCIVCLATDINIKQLKTFFEISSKILALNGRLTVIINNYDVSGSEIYAELQHVCTKNWTVYHEGLINSDELSQAIHGITLVHNSYDPILHAMELSKIGRPDYALAILNEVPSKNITTDDDLVLLLSEKQRHFLTWQQLFKGYAPDHLFFTKERREFGQATSIKPDFVESYRIHSQFWSHMGRNDMALRTLRSIEYVCPHEQTRTMIRSLEIKDKKPCNLSLNELPFNGWQDGWPVPRILVISHEYSDYGIDTLYHGLCTLIGKENVVEFPWKPTLHGNNFVDAHEYPCVFEYSGTPCSVEELVLQLQAGCFDFIVYSDIIKMEHRESVRRLVSAAPNIPIVVYDTWDDCYTPMAVILAYLGIPEVDLVFKREMLASIDYGPKTYPLPFGYQENLAISNSHYPERNNREPFWAGKKMHGLRPLYLQRLETIVGHSLEARMDQSTYRQKLRSSLIGICFFGFGFDSVRYWELPANGSMLLAERSPILIPNNFDENVSAVFFDDLRDMENKLEYYLKRPDEAAEIAANGHQHFLQYHTTTARARLFLGIVFQQLATRLSLYTLSREQHHRT